MNPLVHDQGVGVGLRPCYHSLFMEQPPRSVHWAEVISENFMPWAGGTELGRAFRNLEKVRRHLPIALHGVSLNVGSVDTLNLDYLRRLRILIDAIEPFVVSDHLCWTGVQGQNVHDLLPVPYTQEALALVSEKISRTQDFLGRRILIENPSSYLQFQHSEMPEWEFLQNLVRSTDCGILLDINNVYVSSVNHGFDPRHYLQQIPLESVGQIHLAGHSVQQGYLIDTHDAPVSSDVWQLYQWFVTQKAGKFFFSTMLERDAQFPQWPELELELLKIAEIRHEQASLAG